MTIMLLITVILAVILFTAVWKIHPLPVLLLGGFAFGVCTHRGVVGTLNLLASGFGGTVKSIGLVIIAGTLIGAFMERRGALRAIAEKIIALTGEKRAPLAMSIIGFVVSICIFCDSAFIILIGLWKKIGRMAKLPLALGATALSMGLFASHCFIPPTPGPLAALSILGADFGKVLLFGAIAAAAATCGGYLYSMRAGRNEVLDEDAAAAAAETAPEVIFRSHWSIAFLPIVVPLVLIGANSVISVMKSKLPAGLVDFSAAAGHPVSALTVGALIAIFLIGRCRRDELTVDGVIGKAVLDAANILAITGAGGAFGEVLKGADLKALLPAHPGSLGVLALLIPLAFAAVLKIAQGSSTLAIITAASVTAPMLGALKLDTPNMRALCCCAVCCGSMIVSHTNDSYFWVVTKFSGMSVRQGLKLHTVGTLVSGLFAMAALLVISLFCR